MTQMIATNDSNDIFLDDNGNISIIFALPAVLQACEHAVKAQFDEMIYASTSGIPNFQTIWRGGDPNVDQFDAAIRVAILSVPDVTGVQSLNIKIENNQLSYNATINTIYGPVISSGIGANPNVI